MNFDLHKERIKRIQDHLKEGEILLLYGASHLIRNRDVEYKFRQNSDFFYITGIQESDSIFYATKYETGMFCLPKDKEKEIWTGIRLGKKKIKALLDLTNTFDNTEFSEKIESILVGNHTLYYAFGESEKRDSFLTQICKKVSDRTRDGRIAPETIARPNFLHEWRLKKSYDEIEIIKKAVEITKQGHLSLLKETKITHNEFELVSILEREYLKFGAWGGGYGHIVASGQNSCILHYVDNDRSLTKDSIVLVDSGAEFQGYTADVTRVFPTSAQFLPEQRIIYDVVLAAQKNAIQLCKIGTVFQEIHEKTVRFLSDCLLQMGFLKGSLDKVIEKAEYKKFYMHKTSHFLGMDVHDVGKYFLNGKSRKLEEGFLLTIEPGLYFDPNDVSIPKSFRGIGIRIEDDVLVTKKGPVNLTESIPKEVGEIEAIRREALLV